jgi:hypothetical protein
MLKEGKRMSERRLTPKGLQEIRERAEKVGKLALHDKAHIVVTQTTDTLKLLDEIEELQAEINLWRNLADESLNKQLQLIGETTKYTEHIRKARKQRDEMRSENALLFSENADLRAQLEAAKCCGNCEYWMPKYQKCEHPEQRSTESGDYESPREKKCELWEPSYACADNAPEGAEGGSEE